MSALGIQDLDDETVNSDNNEHLNTSRTRNNSLIDVPETHGLPREEHLEEQKHHLGQSLKYKDQASIASQFLKMGKKEPAQSFMNEQQLFITQVTLTLDVMNNQANHLPSWKYNAIRRNPISTFSYLNHSNYHNNTNNSRLSAHPNRKYYQKSFFLTSSNHLDSFEKDVNDSENPLNKQESKHRKLRKSRNSFDLHEENEEHFSHILPVQQQQQKPSLNSIEHSSDHNHNRKHKHAPTSTNSSVVSNSSNGSKNKENIKSKQENQNKHFFLESSRTKTSVGDSSISSVDTHRSSGRYSCTIAEFNSFKNNLLKNHSRNYKNSSNNDAQPFVVHHSALNNKSGVKASKIKNIYETIERDCKQSKNYPVDTRRSNYLKNLKKTETLLSSSLIIKKL